MKQAEFTKKFKAAAKRVLNAEREHDRASEEYDKMRDVARKNGWTPPRTALTNPFPR